MTGTRALIAAGAMLIAGVSLRGQDGAAVVPQAPEPIQFAVVKKARAVYPDEARRARVEGTVLVEADIAQDGRVVGARVTQSVPLLDRAALEAIEQYEFKVVNGGVIYEGARLRRDPN